MRLATSYVRSPKSPLGSTASQPRGMAGKLGVIYQASSEVTKAIFFAATIIIAGFVPLFTLSGVEGHIFGPMAKTYAYALSGGLLATFTVSPALAAVLCLLPRAGFLLALPLALATFVLALHLFRVWDDQERQILLGALGAFTRRQVAGSEV